MKQLIVCLNRSHDQNNFSHVGHFQYWTLEQAKFGPQPGHCQSLYLTAPLRQSILVGIQPIIFFKFLFFKGDERWNRLSLSYFYKASKRVVWSSWRLCIFSGLRNFLLHCIGKLLRHIYWSTWLEQTSRCHELLHLMHRAWQDIFDSPDICQTKFCRTGV